MHVNQLFLPHGKKFRSDMTKSSPKAGKESINIQSTEELGNFIREFRKNKQLSLEKVSGISKLGMRFISELERGKETAEVGKVLEVIKILGLELIVQPKDKARKL